MTHNGFSLTEVLIALVVLSIGLMGTSQVMFSTMTSNTLNRQHTGATELLQDRMERLQRGDYHYFVSFDLHEVSFDKKGGCPWIYTPVQPRCPSWTSF